MKNEDADIGLFEGMFEHNTLTFNPKNVRDIEASLTDQGVEMETSSCWTNGRQRQVKPTNLKAFKISYVTSDHEKR